MHFYVILKSLPISDDRGPSSFEGTSTVLRLKFMYVSSFDSINIRTPTHTPPHTPPHTHTQMKMKNRKEKEKKEEKKREKETFQIHKRGSHPIYPHESK